MLMQRIVTQHADGFPIGWGRMKERPSTFAVVVHVTILAGRHAHLRTRSRLDAALWPGKTVEQRPRVLVLALGVERFERRSFVPEQGVDQTSARLGVHGNGKCHALAAQMSCSIRPSMITASSLAKHTAKNGTNFAAQTKLHCDGTSPEHTLWESCR